VEVEEAAWNAWLARLRVPLVEVVYEDLAARRARTMGSVVGRLGIRVPAWVDLANRSPRRPHPSGRQVE
jgi:LPS sulfotransferase NodH